MKAAIRLPGGLLVMVVMLAASRVCRSQTYSLIDLGSLPDHLHSRALGIGNHGAVVGSATNDLSLGPDRAFLVDSGAVIDLGTLGGDTSTAHAVGGDGTIVGQASAEPGPAAPVRAFTWFNGVIGGLGTLGGNSSWALDINAAGVVVGGSRVAGDLVFHPCRWVNGVAEDLGLLPDHWVGSARAVNPGGTIVGFSTSMFSEARAVLFADRPVDLGTLPGGCCSEAFDVNDGDKVVGFSWVSGASHRHATLWDGGTITDLGTLPGGGSSVAYGINTVGKVVGMSWTTMQRPGDPHACLWHQDTIVDLNDVLDGPSDWVLVEARAIDDAGRIAVAGTDSAQGVTHALLLTPVPAVPGDFNGDRVVDTADYAVFFDCIAGPDREPAPQSVAAAACLASFDREPDRDVDLRDLADLFQAIAGN
ncbi:MAG: hypothetical protein ACE5EX_05175 [Phycisphaerae bacterium]